jgi:hypothetical protein
MPLCLNDKVREALEDSTDEASLDALQALLGEADAIPVVMVRAHLPDSHKASCA